MWVRSRGLTVYYPACYNDPKQLGSSGFLPALQTYLCRLNNTCWNYPLSTDDTQISGFIEMISNASEALSLLLENKDTGPIIFQLYQLIRNTSSNVDVLNTYWDGYISVNLSTQSFNYSKSISNQTLNTIFTNPISLTNLHQKWLIKDNSTQTKSNSEVMIEILLQFSLPIPPVRYQNETDVKNAFCTNNQFNKTFQLKPAQQIARDTAKNELCSLSDSDLFNFLITLKTDLDGIYMKEKLSNISTPILIQNVYGMHAVWQNLTVLLNSLNMTLFPSENQNNISFSFAGICGGREDLSRQFQVSPPTNSVLDESQEINETSVKRLKRSKTKDNIKRSSVKALASPSLQHLLESDLTKYSKMLIVSSKAETSNSTNTTSSDIDWIDFASNLMYFNDTELCEESFIYGSGDIQQIQIINRTCRCVYMDQILNSISEIRFLIRLIRPLLYGKILYYPNNPQYNQIIKRMNAIFESLDEFIILMKNIQKAIYPSLTVLNRICSRLPLFGNINCSQIQSYQYMAAIFTVFQEFLSCTERNRFQPVESSADLVTKALNLSFTYSFLAGIEFLNDIVDDELPKHIKYKIRMPLDSVDSTFRQQNRYFSFKPRTDAPLSTKYFSFGFIYLMNSLERAFISIQTNTSLGYGVKTQQYPYPCYVNDKFINAVSRMLPLFMVLGWIFTVSMNVKDIVHEKEKRLKEIMKIMGLYDTVHWFSWFIWCSFIMMITAIFLVLIIKYGNITRFSNFLILLIFFLCFTFATITQCFLMSVFFNRANLAACGAGILFFLLYLPYTVLLNYSDVTLRWHKIISCLSSTVAFGIGCDYIAKWEERAKGIQWDNINKGTRPADNFSFLYCMIMMLIDSIIYMFFTWYIENVFPGEFGIPKPWYFPFTKTYWFGYDVNKIRKRTEYLINLEKNQSENTNELDNRVKQRSASIESYSDGEVGVEIINLCKYYNNKLALKNLSVKFYQNQITSFLGRNGAGKSTTWSILTGLIPPTSGTAYIDGWDILTDIKKIRQNIGFTPQHNVLFDLLTVREHLEFFARLKGAADETIDIEIERMLDDLMLTNKRDNYSTELSGGMKRKLSIAIAFCANSKTVILDEPTAGVDPFARRSIWDLLLKYKQGRTIIISTHFMDEADLLGDRIAIISSGELRCVGTSMFLKRKYAEGYNLIVEFTSVSDEEELKTHSDENVMNNNSTIDDNASKLVNSSNIELRTISRNNKSGQFEKLTDFLKSFISDISVKEEHGDQITYVILDDEAHTRFFPEMLKQLDKRKELFRIKNYGLSNSNLEQVFLNVADEAKCVEDYERSSVWKKLALYIKKCFGCKTLSSNVLVSEENNEQEIVSDTCLSDEWGVYAKDRHTGLSLIGIQFLALIIKRFHRTKRNTKGFIAELILPIIFVLLAMLVATLKPNQQDSPPLILHPWYWYTPNYFFQSLAKDASNVSQSTLQTFYKSPSIGTRCMNDTMLDRQKYPCNASAVGYTYVQPSSQIMAALNAVNYNQTKISPECDCDKKMQTCPVGASGPPPSYDQIETKDIVKHLTDYNITDWIIKTQYNDEYVMKRFGGIEFLSKALEENGINTINTSLINQLANMNNIVVNEEKIAELFRIHQPQVAVWYDNMGWPSSLAYLNIFNNALLRSLLPSSDVKDYGITAIQHPLPQTQIEIDLELQSRAYLELFTAICVIFALAFIPASFLVFLIDERATTSKHLQFVSGVKGIIYWVSNYAWDIVNFTVSLVFCVIIFLAFNVQAYVHKENLLCLILLLFLYGFATIPLMYPFSYLFKTPSTGFVLISCINIFLGLITTISTFTLENISDEPDLQKINVVLMKVFLIFPHYCLGRGLFDMSKLHAADEIISKYNPYYQKKSPFEFNQVGRNLMALAIEGIIFFIFALLIQYRFFIADRIRRKPPKIVSIEEDDDVAAERQRLYNDPNNTSHDVLRMTDLIKVYGWQFGKKFTAVNNICAGVKQGECFGLLGINGSGKSTTFKMLTGEIPLTSGNAYVMEHSVLKDIDGVHRNLGYCPQFDALDNLLTAREHLYFYARLRGIKQQNIPYISGCLLKRLGLTLWADRPVRQYSGGNKRKLSTAIALIGNPSVIFMDEPTTGMDVRAKRFLWDCILTLTRKEHKSVIITSHSMEECEVLCNRLSIMVAGEFKCFGSVQHLKAKFGDGYTIILRTNAVADIDTLTQYIIEHLPEATLKEKHNKVIHFRVTATIKLYEMFSVLERARVELSPAIEDYTVTQVTLDDVFVSFAKYQDVEKDFLNESQAVDGPVSKISNLTARIIQDEQNKIEKPLKRNIFSKLINRKKFSLVEFTKL
ncbi:unnamed protein product [Didymodactylos carnosus]|nr:unnamed protein product [Didymodactylos carnosus]CAF3672370.1 unnamed protein product [Didymodactylos carnosus]